MTQKQLAKLAGVTQSTVYNAFSGSPKISEETRERIFQLAKQHGCFDKYNKKRFKKKIIAVICPEINSEYYSTILNLLTQFIEEHDALMILGTSKFDEHREKNLYIYYSAYAKVDGIIIIDTIGIYTNEVIVPTVSIFAQNDSKPIDNIKYSIDAAMRDILSLLKELGHTKIGFAGETLTKATQDVFKNTAQRLAISLGDSSIKVSEKRFEEAGKEAVQQWINEDCLPTAIIAAYDYIAIGAMNELAANGYRVPHDVSIVGSNDITISKMLEPSLSSFYCPKEDYCREAVSLIFKKIDNQYYRSRHVTEIPAIFVLRESVGAAPKK